MLCKVTRLLIAVYPPSQVIARIDTCVPFMDIVMRFGLALSTRKGKNCK
jgi:hypothetical protein